MLVIIALVAGTRGVGQSRHARDVYVGAGIALALSIALAWAVNHIIGDNGSDTLEGMFQLLAAATLFYVSSWMTSKTQAKQWRKFISTQVEIARRSKGPSIALGLTAFLAVMREGAETIVFFQALAAGATETAERHAVMMGVVAGAIALTISLVVLKRIAYLLPIGPVFSVTSVLLYALAVVFAGQGVASFQESGVVSATFINHVPTIQMLGIFPTVQTLTAQAILLVLALASVLAPVVRRFRAAPESPVASRTAPPVPSHSQNLQRAS
jgi:high-affinity iron transporter